MSWEVHQPTTREDRRLLQQPLLQRQYNIKENILTYYINCRRHMRKNINIAFYIEEKLPIREQNCASRMFIMNGRESSTVYVSDENLLMIRPAGVMSKNLTLA